MIKAESSTKVKVLMTFLFLWILTISHSIAQTQEIEAEEFEIKIEKISHSGQVILFSDPSENNPKPGNILLIKDNQDEVVAVRVIKNFQGNFAAKIVLPFRPPILGQNYRALKKLGDKLMAQIQELEKKTKLDQTDEQLAKEVAPKETEKQKQDPLFDKKGNELESIELEEEDDEAFSDLTVQEGLPLETHHHNLTLEYAKIHNFDNNAADTTYNALGLRYAYNLFNMPFIKKHSLQDLIALEVGLFYYTISPFRDPNGNDSITLMSAMGTGRYNLLVGETFTFFAYGGVLQNIILQNNAVNARYLVNTRAAYGGGVMLTLGPAWAIRLDYGADLFGIGVVLKF